MGCRPRFATTAIPRRDRPTARRQELRRRRRMLLPACLQKRPLAVISTLWPQSPVNIPGTGCRAAGTAISPCCLTGPYSAGKSRAFCRRAGSALLRGRRNRRSRFRQIKKEGPAFGRATGRLLVCGGASYRCCYSMTRCSAWRSCLIRTHAFLESLACLAYLPGPCGLLWCYISNARASRPWRPSDVTCCIWDVVQV